MRRNHQNQSNRVRCSLLFVTVLLWLPLVTLHDAAAAQETTQRKIENALSAAPEYIAREAAVWDWAAVPGGELSVLRQGTNGWTCFPSPPQATGNSPRCFDEVFLPVALANMRGEPPSVDRVGLSYMLQGGPAVDAEGRQTLGPHVMIVLPPSTQLAQGMAQGDSPDGPFLEPDMGPGLIWINMPVAAGGEASQVVREQ